MPRVFFPEQLITRYIKVSESLTALGVNAHSTRAGVDNVAVGPRALLSNTTGYVNTAVGADALRSCSSGYSNTGVGYNTLRSLTTARWNVAVGTDSLYSLSAGENNVAVGVGALFANTTASSNTAVGSGALRAVTGGSYNVGVGRDAIRYAGDGVTPAGGLINCVGLGAFTRAYSESDSNAVVIGVGAVSLGSNTVVIGNSAITLTALRGRVGCGTESPAADARVHLHDGHLVHSQTTAPTAAVTANAGTGASASLSNATDLRGVLTLTTGTASWAAGAQVTVTFNQAYVTAPVIALTPANANAATQATARGVYVSATTTSFSVNFAVADTAQRTYVWHYIVVG